MKFVWPEQWASEEARNTYYDLRMSIIAQSIALEIKLLTHPARANRQRQALATKLASLNRASNAIFRKNVRCHNDE